MQGRGLCQTAEGQGRGLAARRVQGQWGLCSFANLPVNLTLGEQGLAWAKIDVFPEI